MKSRYLIVDDEPMARARLVRLIREIEPSATLVEAGDGLAALEKIEQDGPFEAVLLDVEMPGLSGFDVLRKLPASVSELAVIFCTAFPRYAVQAFQEAAVDYLVKPVEAERLRMALGRTARHALSKEKLLELEKQTASALLFKLGDKLVPISWQDVIVCRADHKLTSVVTLDREFLTEKSLDELEGELPAGEFVRCHRSALVNLKHALSLGGKDQLTLTLRRNQEAPVSRRRRTELVERLKKGST